MSRLQIPFARLSVCLVAVVCGKVFGAETVDFQREVRPILAQYCFRCHGVDASARQGQLRLDLAEAATKAGESGRIAIVPGKPEVSEVVRRLYSKDPDEQMPPPDPKHEMPIAARETLTQWIREGAVYHRHWAWIPPVQSPVPDEAVNLGDAKPSRHPIDRFLRRQMSQAGLVPSPEADRYTLVRRVYMDLTGLPPTPEEADAFVNDSSPDAWEKLVDQLLASPQYGERWARRWLDLARYADTNGYEKDRARTIWPYRDWVVKALNEDMPYDRFSMAQLAGDLFPDPTPGDVIATGFHRNTMVNEEGGIDPLEFRFYSMVDRVAVTGATWFGLTLNCAQCHTHKYDPIEHAEFYRLMALLNNADEPTWSIPADNQAELTDAHARRIQELEAELPSKYPGGTDAMNAAFDQWVTTARAKSSEWTVVVPRRMMSSLPHLEAQPDGFILGNGDISKSDTYELEILAPIRNATAIRIEVASHPSLPNDGPGLTWYEGPIGGFFLSELRAAQNGRTISFSSAEETNSSEEDRINDGAGGRPRRKKDGAAPKRNVAAAAIDGEMSSGWQVLGGSGVSHAAVFRFASPVDLSDGLTLTMLFEKHFACSLGHFRISVTSSDHASATGYPADVEALLTGQTTWSDGERKRVLMHFLETTPEMQEAAQPLLEARNEPPRGQTTLVMRERPANNPRPTFRYHRGEYLQPREEVSPAVPAFLPALPDGQPANRLALARWLFSPDNPLTARVAVNRQWQAFFGRGLVRTLDDFGLQSDPPSHPELLDWMAVEFRRNGWSMKSLHRLIVTSAAYRQASRPTPEQSARDPENVLLSRSPGFRLEAEIIRDSALRAAGLLSLKMGGPGVFPPQPASVTTEGTYGGFEWKTSEGEDRYRRSLYTFAKRTAPFAMMTTFDAPSGESCVARRDVSSSPLQALTLLNDQMFFEIAQAMARQVVQEAGTSDDRIVRALRRCLTRPPLPEEMESLREFVRTCSAESTDELFVWTSVCRALMNLDETVVHP